jgi:predicted PurR-regulated permease PerM
MERINWQRTRDILISVICIGILLWAVGSILGQFLHAVVLLLLSMAVAFLITPAVNFLAKQKYMPRVVAALIVYLLVLAALGALGYALVFTLIKQVESFSSVVINYFDTLPDKYTQFQQFLVNQGIPQKNIDAAIAQIQLEATNFAQSLATNALNIVFAITDVFVNILLVAVLGFYLTLDGKRIRDSLFNIVPKRSQSFFLLSEDALNRVVGNYIRGQLTLALIIGILAGGGCLLPSLGLANYALFIGVLAFLFETIPMVGPALASIPAILISLLLPEPFPRTFYVVIYFVIVQLIESNILGPRIVGHAVGLHPVASIFALIVGAQLFGAFGALLATPIVAATWVVVSSLYRSARGETADEMLAKRRISHPLPRLFSRQLESDGIHPVEDEDSGHQVTATHVKPTHIAGKIDQIDLMRPVPGMHEQHTNAHTHNHKQDGKGLSGEPQREET